MNAPTIDLAERIAARRKHIQDQAPCVGCGGTLANCLAQRGKDPTAPVWFGCCARGIGADVPCDHRPDNGALLALLKEIETGKVRTVDEVRQQEAADHRSRTGMDWFAYLNQGVKWQPNGKPMVAVADMDPEWRHNAARWLERHATVIGQRYAFDQLAWFTAIVASSLGPSDTAAESIERDMACEQGDIARDPVAWIRATTLHNALTAGLPTKGKRLAKLAERAKHWSSCPARTNSGDCRCEQIRAEQGGEVQS